MFDQRSSRRQFCRNLAAGAISVAVSIDIWPRPHADHREQVQEMGNPQFLRLLEEYQVRLGVITRYDLGPYNLQDEMHVLKQLFADSPHLGIALAPYHLPQDAAIIARLIGDLGPKLVFFQAWQHGMGSFKPLPKQYLDRCLEQV